MLLCEQPGRTGVYATATPERISLYHLGALWPLSHIAASSAPGSLGANSSARRWGPPLAPSFTVPFSRLCDDDGDLARRVPMSLSLSCAAYEEMRFFVSDAAGGAWIGAADGTAQALHAGATGPFGSAYGGHAAVVASGWDPRNAAVLALGRCDGVVQLLDIESGGLGHYRAGPKSAIAKVVQERALHGTVTDLDWVPLSHMTVVAARRPDSAGYYAEVMDLRSPESGIRYLGAPRMGANTTTTTATATATATSITSTAITSAGAGSFVPAPCYAERVACDASQTYVAVVGTHGRRDMVQLWDLRLTSRPVQWHDYPRAGYTSLRWSPCEPMTVVATTRNGRLRLHSFACCEAGVNEEGGSDKGDIEDDDEEEKQRGSGFSHPSEMEYDVTSSRSMTASRSHTNGGSWLHARVPAASVAWWSDDRAETKNYASKASPVAMGRRTDMPCLLLLNAKTGLLHPQVFSRIGSTVAMAGDVALCGAGPNVFLLPHLMEDHTNTNINTNMDTTMNTNIKSNANSDPATLRGLPGGAVSPIVINTASASGDDLITLNASPFRVSTDSVPIPHGRFAATRTLPHVEGPQWAVNHLDRTTCRRERLCQGFLLHALKPLMVLTCEGIDSEACALFRYGWLVQRQQHPGRQAMPATDIAPGLIELLQREHPCSQQQKQRYQQDQSPPSPQHQPLGMRELILRAMGWCADPNDDSFPANASPSSVLRTSIDDALDLFPTSPVVEVEATDALPPPQHHQHHHQQQQQLEPMDLVGTASRQEAVERRAAILTCMGRLHDAATMLARHSDLHALYPTLALQLSFVSGAGASVGPAAQGSAPPERHLTGPGGAGCTHWMDLCLALAESVAPARGALPLSARNEFFAHTMKRFRRFLPLTDQIALAAALLLPPAGAAPTKEERAAMIQVLHDMLQRQLRPHGSGCSLLLAAAVEGIDRECTSLQRYIDETGDVQTPICYVALYGPAGRGAWRGWNDAYRAQLNAESDAMLRSLHDLSYIKMIRLRESENMNNNNSNNNTNDNNNNENNNNNNSGGGGGALRQSHGLIGVPFVGFAQGEPVKAKPPNRDGRLSVVLLCGCGQPMHTRAAAIAVNNRPAGCRQMTRCGNPECRLGQTPICVVCCERLDKRGGDGAVENYFAWCTVCLHGGHWAHLRDWFEKHRSCPVEDCPCQCVYDRAN